MVLANRLLTNLLAHHVLIVETDQSYGVGLNAQNFVVKRTPLDLSLWQPSQCCLMGSDFDLRSDEHG